MSRQRPKARTKSRRQPIKRIKVTGTQANLEEIGVITHPSLVDSALKKELSTRSRYISPSKTEIEFRYKEFDPANIDRLEIKKSGIGDGINYVVGSEVFTLISGGIDNDYLVGSDKNDEIVGNEGNDYIIGGLGKDKLTGSSGADYFRLAQSEGDIITDFNSNEGDKIVLAMSVITLTTNVTFQSANQSELESALLTANQFVYNTFTGELLLNINGSLPGTGTDGILAILDNKASLSSRDLILI
jgi:Ca2+-binding RTX toxin-like protein